MKDKLTFPEESWIAYEILAYLLDHPDAQDTLEGVAEWWMLERKALYRIVQVREALHELVQKGYLIEKVIDVATARSFYRVNDQKTEEIKELLRRIVPEQ